MLSSSKYIDGTGTAQTFPFQKGEIKGIKGPPLPSKSETKNSYAFQGLRMTLCGFVQCPLGLWWQPPPFWPLLLHLQVQSHSPVSLRVAHICSWLSLSASFLPAESQKSARLPSFCPVSVPFGPNWPCFCWCNILTNLVSLLCVMEISASRHECYPQMLFGWPRLYPWLLLRWSAGSICHIPNFLSKMMLSSHTLGAFSWAHFLNSEFPNCSNLDKNLPNHLALARLSLTMSSSSALFCLGLRCEQ